MSLRICMQPPWQTAWSFVPILTEPLLISIRMGMNGQAGLYIICIWQPPTKPRSAPGLRAVSRWVSILEGGHVTGTHVHIARKYNGEWIPADGLAFNLEGWVAHDGGSSLRRHADPPIPDGSTPARLLTIPVLSKREFVEIPVGNRNRLAGFDGGEAPLNILIDCFIFQSIT